MSTLQSQAGKCGFSHSMLKLHQATFYRTHMQTHSHSHFSDIKFNCNASHERILTIHQFTIYRMGIEAMAHSVSHTHSATNKVAITTFAKRRVCVCGMRACIYLHNNRM